MPGLMARSGEKKSEEKSRDGTHGISANETGHGCTDQPHMRRTSKREPNRETDNRTRKRLMHGLRAGLRRKCPRYQKDARFGAAGQQARAGSTDGRGVQRAAGEAGCCVRRAAAGGGRGINDNPIEKLITEHRCMDQVREDAHTRYQEGARLGGAGVQRMARGVQPAGEAAGGGRVRRTCPRYEKDAPAHAAQRAAGARTSGGTGFQRIAGGSRGGAAVQAGGGGRQRAAGEAGCCRRRAAGSGQRAAGSGQRGGGGAAGGGQRAAGSGGGGAAGGSGKREAAGNREPRVCRRHNRMGILLHGPWAACGGVGAGAGAGGAHMRGAASACCRIKRQPNKAADISKLVDNSLLHNCRTSDISKPHIRLQKQSTRTRTIPPCPRRPLSYVASIVVFEQPSSFAALFPTTSRLPPQPRRRRINIEVHFEKRTTYEKGRGASSDGATPLTKYCLYDAMSKKKQMSHALMEEGRSGNEKCGKRTSAAETETSAVDAAIGWLRTWVARKKGRSGNSIAHAAVRAVERASAVELEIGTEAVTLLPALVGGGSHDIDPQPERFTARTVVPEIKQGVAGVEAGTQDQSRNITPPRADSHWAIVIASASEQLFTNTLPPVQNSAKKKPKRASSLLPKFDFFISALSSRLLMPANAPLALHSHTLETCLDDFARILLSELR
ncbi:hypothetical protein GGX14DRAFT_408854 [Mycena pura]|uniref:Uncharacterized protein n=1 Tax=Mycena pura TaxID=153505 RepID=A0AAD6UK89_9AGAR|nr:hypothetical protein GGX14DRAFT_408854 [Mycena pura]